ncbi:hypothetical protein GOODEAATRI_028536 [Goodea atripinnis]|uniref:Secreted protein n=1 Tax=Goodea atripinnis TaxID=208336 RepID=A0ABV0MLY6_9TELE
MVLVKVLHSVLFLWMGDAEHLKFNTHIAMQKYTYSFNFTFVYISTINLNVHIILCDRAKRNQHIIEVEEMLKGFQVFCSLSLVFYKDYPAFSYTHLPSDSDQLPCSC